MAAPEELQFDLNFDGSSIPHPGRGMMTRNAQPVQSSHPSASTAEKASSKRKSDRSNSSPDYGSPSIPGADKRIKTLEKNRESARESRRRKKEYIGTLEARVKELEAEVHQLRAQSHPYSRDQIAQARQGYMEQIKAMLPHPLEATNATLDPVLEQILRLNAETTIPSLDYHIGKIVELLQPFPYLKFLMWGIGNSETFFIEDEQGRPQGLWATLIKELGLNADQMERVKSLREVMRAQVRGQHLLLSNIKKLQDFMRQQLVNGDQVLRSLKAFIPPLEQSKFLVWVEQNEACMQLVDTIWNATTQALMADLQQPAVIPPAIVSDLVGEEKPPLV